MLQILEDIYLFIILCMACLFGITIKKLLKKTNGNESLYNVCKLKLPAMGSWQRLKQRKGFGGIRKFAVKDKEFW